MREADAARARPIDDRSDERPRLRQEGEVTLERHAVAEAGVQSDFRQQQAEAVRTLNAQACRLRRFQHLAAQHPAHSCSDHDGRARSLGAELCDQAGHGHWRCRDHTKIGHAGQLGDRSIAPYAIDAPMVRIDQPYRPGKAAGSQIGRHDRTDARRLLARADEGHRLRSQQLIEIAYGHDLPAPAVTVAGRLDRQPAAQGPNLAGGHGDLMRQDAFAFLSQKNARHR